MEDPRGIIDQRKPYCQKRIEDTRDESVYDELPNH